MSRRWVQAQTVSNELHKVTGKEPEPVRHLDAVDGLLMGLIEHLERSENPTVNRLKRDGMVRFDTGFVLDNMPSLHIGERSLRQRLDKLEESGCLLRKTVALGRERGSNRYVRRSPVWCRVAGALDQAMDDNLNLVIERLVEDLDRQSASGLNDNEDLDRQSASGAYERQSASGAYERQSASGQIDTDSKGKKEREGLELLDSLPWKTGAPCA